MAERPGDKEGGVNEHGRFGELKRSWDNWSVTVASGLFMFIAGCCLMLLLLAISPLLLAAWIYGRFSK